jgi:uncharacterized protein YyaL (SSP411 family)
LPPFAHPAYREIEFHMPNRLAKETSPYLLQHKDNPVDWHPWGEEALTKARSEDKPIFLSIGYSACHWCHVMEHESFENDEIAALMNELFVNIKVDREERPDIDSIYMAAVQAMTGQGGWPMSMFLTPDGKPFYAGTYFPPDERGGLPSFPRVLQATADAYRNKRGEITQTTQRVEGYLREQSAAKSSADPLTRDIMSNAYRALAPTFDSEHGGFGRAPKFPQAMTYEFLLRYWHATGDAEALRMVELTLDKMARGGMCDQLGGGFHRYATDAIWLVPHFEKMLYDNAQLASLYLHAWQATGKQEYAGVVHDILSYVEREMLDSSGGFYCAQDADSEGEEGKFFIWNMPEINSILGSERARIARAYWALTDAGNFEGRNILWRPRRDEEVAVELSMSVDALREAISEIRYRLLAERGKRVKPGLDDKVLSSWNALMLKAFAEAGASLNEPRYVDIARSNAEFIMDNLEVDGRLLRTWKASASGGTAKLNGYLEDYAFVIDALLVLYESTFEERWLRESQRLASTMIELLHADGVFFDTPSDNEQLIVRPRDIFDNATPSGGSMAALALLRLAVFTGNDEYRSIAVSSLRSVRDYMERMPSGFANWLAALDFYLSTPMEIVVIGPRDNDVTEKLLSEASSRYLPNRAVAGSDSPIVNGVSPLLEGRVLVDGKPTAYVCENYACQMPVTEPEALAEQLDRR